MTLNHLTLSLQFARFDGDTPPTAPCCRATRSRAGFATPWPTDAEITVRIVGEDEGRQLNRDYRTKDYATNVLTFDYTQEPLVTADLVLCAPVVEREAREQNKSLEEHYAHLLVHGTLHAQGWDHETSEADARGNGSLRNRHPAGTGLCRPLRPIARPTDRTPSGKAVGTFFGANQSVSPKIST
jgi:probable rRNA maturation factor